MRGRAEHGPRALGHRSLLSAPAAGMRERLNALKFREWYRPVAPVVAVEVRTLCELVCLKAPTFDGPPIHMLTPTVDFNG